MTKIRNRLNLFYCIIVLSLIIIPHRNVCSQNRTNGQNKLFPQTRAEQTDYRETSHYEDVIQFLHGLQVKGGPVSVGFIGTSTEGRRIPLVIASSSPAASPAGARRSGKLIVYIQANIHAGEVEGKEAVLMLLRELCEDSNKELLDRMVLLVAPVYNADGNEAWGPWQKNRRSQNGPDMVGIRANGQGLDLNRDGMKAESPEMRAALKFIYTAWDPDVIIDLHATNGTRHGYQVTYSPPLHPDMESTLLHFNREVLLPAVRARLRAEHNMETFVYGNVPRDGKPEGWYQSLPDPRRITNYVGLRNRISVLSEAACFLPFRERVHATLRFVKAVLSEIAHRGPHIIDLTRKADARVVSWGRQPETAPPLTLRYEIASHGREEVLLEKKTAAERSSGSPERIIPPRNFTPVTMPVFDRFKATRTARLPAAYLIPGAFPETIELLMRHGIIVEKLLTGWKGTTQSFLIDKIISAERPFQGHVLKELTGHFEKGLTETPEGSYMIRTAQPLGILIFHLLEPESIDGAAAWGFLDRALYPDRRYPILKCFEQINISTERLN